MLQSKRLYRLTHRRGYQAIKEFDEPFRGEVNPGMVLIKIKAVALNHRDLSIADGTYPFPVRHRIVPCSDGAGEVIKVGSGVADIKVGDKVIGLFDQLQFYGGPENWFHHLGSTLDGMLQEYRTLPATGVVKIPKDTHLTWEEMASLVCSGVTAWNALFCGPRFVPGNTVFLQGTGGLSVTALILANAAGAETIIASSSDEKLEQVKAEYRPDHAINYVKNPRWDAEAIRVTSGTGVDLMLDIGGVKTLQRSANAVCSGGTIAVMGRFGMRKSEPDANIDATQLLLTKSVTVRGVQIGSKEMLEDLVRFINKKKLRMPIDRVFNFNYKDIQHAFAYLESRKHIGKVCIRMPD